MELLMRLITSFITHNGAQRNERAVNEQRKNRWWSKSRRLATHRFRDEARRDEKAGWGSASHDNPATQEVKQQVCGLVPPSLVFLFFSFRLLARGSRSKPDYDPLCWSARRRSGCLVRDREKWRPCASGRSRSLNADRHGRHYERGSGINVSIAN